MAASPSMSRRTARHVPGVPHDVEHGQGKDRILGRIIALTAMSILAIVAVVSALHAPAEMSHEFLTFVVAIGLAPIGVQVLYKLINRRKSNWLCIELLTMLFFCVVHFTCIIYWLNGENPYDIVMWQSVKAGDGAGRVCFTMALCAAGMAMFGVGYHLLPDRFETAVRRESHEVGELSRWRTTGFRICLATAIVALVILRLQGPAAFEGGYRGTQTGSGLTNVLIRANMVLTVAGAGCLAVASFRQRGKLMSMGIIPTFLLLAVVAGYAIHGDRNMPFNSIVILAVAYSEQARRISISQCLVFTLLAMIGGTLVGVARVSPQRTLSSMYNTIMVNSEKIRPDHALVELGYQAQPLFASTAWVPEKHPYYYGKLVSLEVVGAVPFVTRLPLVQRVYEGTEHYETNSSMLLTWVVLGNFLSGGRGTSSVADLFLNFGMPGVLGGMLAQGLFAKYVQQKARQSQSVFWGCIYAFLVPALAYSARAGVVAVTIEIVLWPSLVMIALRSFMQREAKRRTAGGVARRRSLPARPREELRAH